MQLSVKKWVDREGGEVCVNRKITAKNIVGTIYKNSKKGIKVNRHGRVVQIKFSGKIFEEEISGFLTFNQNEIFLLASLLRRERTDEAFLKAINAASE
jgi:hypothetical protein